MAIDSNVFTQEYIIDKLNSNMITLQVLKDKLISQVEQSKFSIGINFDVHYHHARDDGSMGGNSDSGVDSDGNYYYNSDNYSGSATSHTVNEYMKANILDLVNNELSEFIDNFRKYGYEAEFPEKFKTFVVRTLDNQRFSNWREHYIKKITNVKINCPDTFSALELVEFLETSIPKWIEEQKYIAEMTHIEQENKLLLDKQYRLNGPTRHMENLMKLREIKRQKMQPKKMQSKQ